MLNFWGISFHLYGFILGLGIIMAREVVMKVARERKFDLKILDKVVVVGVIGGIIGARLYHVLDNFSYYSENVVKIFLISEGGLGIWGAIFGGLSSVMIYLWITKKLNKNIVLNVLDLIALGLPLGQAIGRWGNFFNGEIVGKNGEPLFLYESLATFILFLVIYKLRNKKRGKLMGIYLLGYGVIRLFLEEFRNPADVWMLGELSVSTILSLASLVIGIFVLSSRTRFGIDRC